MSPAASENIQANKYSFPSVENVWRWEALGCSMDCIEKYDRDVVLYWNSSIELLNEDTSK